MFVTYVEPQGQGNERETLGILVNRTDGGTRGSISLLSQGGASTVIHNVPLDGNQVQDGAFFRESEPSYITTPPETEPESDEDSYTIGR